MDPLCWISKEERKWTENWERRQSWEIIIFLLTSIKTLKRLTNVFSWWIELFYFNVTVWVLKAEKIQEDVRDKRRIKLHKRLRKKVAININFSSDHKIFMMILLKTAVKVTNLKGCLVVDLWRTIQGLILFQDRYEKQKWMSAMIMFFYWNFSVILSKSFTSNAVHHYKAVQDDHNSAK